MFKVEYIGPDITELDLKKGEHYYADLRSIRNNKQLQKLFPCKTKLF